jgi:glycosyltransferase involved in cell wall biosynthesis
LRALHFHTNEDLGGGERQVLALLTRSASHGVEAELLTTPRGALAGEAAAAGVPVHRVARRFSYDPLATRRVVKILRERAIDVLHVHDGFAASLGVFAANAAGVPVLVHRRIASPLRDNWLTRRKYSPKRVARFLAVSETVAGALRAFGLPAEKIRIVPSGVDIAALRRLPKGRGRELLTPELRGATPLLGTIGKLAPKKGIDVILGAFAEIRAKLPDAALLVVGGGPEETALRALARFLGLDDGVVFTGPLPDGPAVLADLDMFLFASELEGSPGVLREAMALGVPIVTVDTPGCVEVAGDAALTVPRGDAPALAAAALALHADPSRAAALRAAGLARVESRFSLDAMVAATVAAARDAAGRAA